MPQAAACCGDTLTAQGGYSCSSRSQTQRACWAQRWPPSPAQRLTTTTTRNRAGTPHNTCIFWRPPLLPFHLEKRHGPLWPVFANQTAPGSLRDPWLCAGSLQKATQPCPVKAQGKQPASCATPATCSYQGLDHPAQQKTMT